MTWAPKSGDEWTVDATDRSVYVLCNGLAVLHVLDGNNPETRAKAAFFAAAPALLAALRDVLIVAAQYGLPEMDATAQNARAAIAQAGVQS